MESLKVYNEGEAPEQKLLPDYNQFVAGSYISGHEYAKEANDYVMSETKDNMEDYTSTVSRGRAAGAEDIDIQLNMTNNGFEAQKVMNAFSLVDAQSNRSKMYDTDVAPGMQPINRVDEAMPYVPFNDRVAMYESQGKTKEEAIKQSKSDAYIRKGGMDTTGDWSGAISNASTSLGMLGDILMETVAMPAWSGMNKTVVGAVDLATMGSDILAPIGLSNHEIDMSKIRIDQDVQAYKEKHGNLSPVTPFVQHMPEMALMVAGMSSFAAGSAASWAQKIGAMKPGWSAERVGAEALLGYNRAVNTQQTLGGAAIAFGVNDAIMHAADTTTDSEGNVLGVGTSDAAWEGTKTSAMIFTFGKLIEGGMWAVGGGQSPATQQIVDQINTNPNYKKDMESLFKHFDEYGIMKTDAMIREIGQKGAQDSEKFQKFLNGMNLYDKKFMVENFDMQTMIWTGMMSKTMDKIKNMGGIDYTSSKSVMAANEVFKAEAKKLRKAYYDMEDEAFKAVEKVASSQKQEVPITDMTTNLIKEMTEEGVPLVATNEIRRVLGRFKKPFADETKRITKINSLVGKNAAEQRKVNQLIKSAGSNEAKIDSLTLRLENLKDARTKLTNERDGFTNARGDVIPGLKDVGYMTVDDLYKTRKLINRKIHTTGQAISTTDKEAIRGLNIAKAWVDDTLAKATEGTEFGNLLTQANSVTRERVKLFGTGDKGSDVFPALGKALKERDTSALRLAVSGTDEEAISSIRYVQQELGQDSEMARIMLNEYVIQKLAGTQKTFSQFLDTTKPVSMDVVAWQDANQAFSSFTPEVIKATRSIMGDDVANALNNTKKTTGYFADISSNIYAAESGLEIGLKNWMKESPGMGAKVGKMLELGKAFTAYNMGKLASKFTMPAGVAAAVVGSGVSGGAYVGHQVVTDQPITVGGMAVAVGAGRAGGMATTMAVRNMLEKDIAKISRVISAGKSPTNQMMDKINAGLERYISNYRRSAPMAPQVNAANQTMGDE